MDTPIYMSKLTSQFKNQLIAFWRQLNFEVNSDIYI
jgi:hypothetical protein